MKSLLLVGYGAMLAFAFGLVVLVLPARERRRRGPLPSRAWSWAERRGVTLTERSVPFVDTYLHNARNLRVVCTIGAPVLAYGFTLATDISLRDAGLALFLAGYLAGSVWAELTLARVPAATTRVASLRVRDLRTYRAPWLGPAQLVLPLVVLVVSALRLLGGPGQPGASVGDALRWATANFGSPPALAALLAMTSLAVIGWSQERIVRRPQPRDEDDLVAADEAMRTSAVHLLGVTHLLLCFLLIVSGLLSLADHLSSERAGTVSTAINLLALVVATVLWGLRSQPPGRVGGSVAPPPFPPEAAAVVDGTAVPTAGETWRAPRHPDAVAVSVIALLFLALFGLRWLGPLNPEITADVVSDMPTRARDQPGVSVDRETFQVVLSLQNRSHTPVRIDGLHLVAAFGGVIPTVTDLTVSDPTDGSVPQTFDRLLPANLPAGKTVRLTMTLAAPDCPQQSFWGYEYNWEIPVTTAVGHSLVIRPPAHHPAASSCYGAMPMGPQPADPATARTAVITAFERVYNGPPSEDKVALVEPADGVAAASAQARESGQASFMDSLSGRVRTVGFDRPDHAWVDYELSRDDGVVVRGNRGQAVLVGDTWKVTRETVCGDLKLVQGYCDGAPR